MGVLFWLLVETPSYTPETPTLGFWDFGAAFVFGGSCERSPHLANLRLQHRYVYSSSNKNRGLGKTEEPLTGWQEQGRQNLIICNNLSVSIDEEGGSYRRLEGRCREREVDSPCLGSKFRRPPDRHRPRRIALLTGELGSNQGGARGELRIQRGRGNL